jgi:hypothetical protein
LNQAYIFTLYLSEIRFSNILSSTHKFRNRYIPFRIVRIIICAIPHHWISFQPPLTSSLSDPYSLQRPVLIPKRHWTISNHMQSSFHPRETRSACCDMNKIVYRDVYIYAFFFTQNNWISYHLLGPVPLCNFIRKKKHDSWYVKMQNSMLQKVFYLHPRVVIYKLISYVSTHS